MIFCTLFDSNYLDKGLVLYKSLVNNVKDFKLYILAMDYKCFQVFEDLNYSEVVPISLERFMQVEKLQEIKEKRSVAEFCWTCTPHLIDYVFEQYGENICTYIDSDLCFYADCACLIEEMGERDVQIVEHRFTKKIEDQIAQKESGKYCVEFNTFKNTSKGRKLLEWWKERCRESCSAIAYDGKVFGDQKYLEEWEENEDVAVLRNLGGGVAPWNVAQYRMTRNEKDGTYICLENKETKEKFKLIFYHFHNITYKSLREVDISVYQRAWGVDDSLIKAIYIPYLLQLNDMKEMLSSKYGINSLIQIHPSFEGRERKRKGIKDLYNSVRKNGIKGMYILLYLNINGVLRKRFKEKKNHISF